jgi:TldD protein
MDRRHGAQCCVLCPAASANLIAMTAKALPDSTTSHIRPALPRASGAKRFDDGRLKTADYSTDAGFGLRGVSGEMTGFAHANEISEAAINRAAKTLRCSIRPGSPPPAAARTNRHLYTEANPLELVPFAEKVALLRQDRRRRTGERPARCPGVRQPRGQLVRDRYRARRWLYRERHPPAGASQRLRRHGRQWPPRDRRFMAAAGAIFMMADRGSHLAPCHRRSAQTGRDQPPLGRRAGGRDDSAARPGWPACCCTRRSAMGLKAISTARAPVAFLGPHRPAVAAPGVTVVDDGSIFERRGSLSIDDEGTPTRRNRADRGRHPQGLYAGPPQCPADGRIPTGNGRRESYAHAPMPRMTNTFMKGGEDDPGRTAEPRQGRHLRQELWRRAGRYRLGQVRLFLHRGLSGEERQDPRPDQGRDADRRWPERADRIVGIGNDMALDEGIGMCGKGGQSVPAGVGQPTLLIDRLTVGGTGG